MELVQNRIYTLNTGSGKQNRLPSPKNGVPQGSVDNNLLPFCTAPTYLAVKMERSLTSVSYHFYHTLILQYYRIKALRKKITKLRILLFRQFAESEQGANAKTLQIAGLSLVYTTSEYSAPVWSHSAHTAFIDSIVTG